ncbi:thioesterase family protein [Magnetovibrio sp. PR-2]|uniref:acyl-CoA thioesterase n=1 Tax=Magnetovibrio sp. PR-2 TaxID=3120356 RepID=UPI002FCE1920
MTDVSTLDDFPFQTFDKIRYGDTDRQGHVNNAVFTTYLETGRCEVLYNPDNGLLLDATSFVIARVDVHFVAEINWPGRVEIGTGISKVGNSSIGLHQAVFQDGTCVCRADSVIVQMNDATRKSQPLSDVAIRFFETHYMTDSA